MRHLALAPRPLPLLAGVCALGLLSGCDVTIKDGDVSFSQLHGRATQEWNRKYPLSAGGTVEIINANGPIEVTAGGPAVVDVAAVLSARAMTDEQAKELLSAAKIEATATQDRVKLMTVRGNRRGGFAVSYKVSVPPDARVETTLTNGSLKVIGVSGHVKAMVVNGEVDLTGLRGSVDVASVNGSVKVSLAEVTDRVRLEGTNGGIALEIPKDTKAVLTARSVNGGITVTGFTTQEASGRRIRNVESVLNGGGPDIDVRIMNGRITIEGK
jgi:hypothetical protein